MATSDDFITLGDQDSFRQDDSGNCLICYDHFKENCSDNCVFLIPLSLVYFCDCKNKICKACVIRWFKQNSQLTCPQCRTSVLEVFSTGKLIKKLTERPSLFLSLMSLKCLEENLVKLHMSYLIFDCDWATIDFLVMDISSTALVAVIGLEPCALNLEVALKRALLQQEAIHFFKIPHISNHQMPLVIEKSSAKQKVIHSTIDLIRAMDKAMASAE